MTRPTSSPMRQASALPSSSTSRRVGSSSGVTSRARVDPDRTRMGHLAGRPIPRFAGGSGTPPGWDAHRESGGRDDRPYPTPPLGSTMGAGTSRKGTCAHGRREKREASDGRDAAPGQPGRGRRASPSVRRARSMTNEEQSQADSDAAERRVSRSCRARSRFASRDGSSWAWRSPPSLSPPRSSRISGQRPRPRRTTRWTGPAGCQPTRRWPASKRAAWRRRPRRMPGGRPRRQRGGAGREDPGGAR